MSRETSYRFVPWVRQGVTPTEGVDPITGPVTAPGRVGVEFEVNTDARSAAARISTFLELYGPGEVVGLDRRQIARTDPEPDAPDFESNYFPAIEFYRADLPWLFSPAAATTDGKLRPWLCLVAVRKQPGVTVTTEGRGALPRLRIGGDADPAAELPDLRESYAWAHAQVVGDDSEPLDESLDPEATNSLSRLLAPRRLREAERYYACVVPTFEPGVRAGLGLDPHPRSGDEDTGRVYEMAWDPENPPQSIELPVYYHWEFTTATAGDFESLVRRLEPEQVSDIGVRSVDASDPGPSSLRLGPVDAPETVDVEGLLRSTDVDPDGYDPELADELRSRLNAGSALKPVTGWPTSSGKPALGPPIYGQWPPGAVEIPEEGDRPAWLRDLNVDPRHRVVAAYGTDVVREQRDQLLAAAWDQIGNVRTANGLLRYAQFDREASASLYETFNDLSPAGLLLRTGPIHSRVLRSATDRTVEGTIAESRVPWNVFGAAFRRLTGPNGALGRAVPDDRRPTPEALVEGINDGRFDAGDGSALPPGATAIPDAERSCKAADEAIEEAADRAVEWNLAELPDPERFWNALEEYQAACESARTVLDTVRDEVGEQYVLNLVAEIESRCGEICESDAIESLTDAFEVWFENPDRGSGLLLDELEFVHEMLTDATDFLDRLERLAEDVGEPSPEGLRRLRAACDRVHDAALRLRWPVLVDALVYDCQRARGILREIPIENAADPDRADRALTDLSILCDAICGDDEERLLAVLAAAFDDSDHETAGDLAAQLIELAAQARERLTDIAGAYESGRVPEPVDELRRACRRFDDSVDALAALLEDRPAAPLAEHLEPVVCESSPTPPSPPLDVDALATDLRTALDPRRSIPRRVRARIDGIPEIWEREDPLDQIMAAPEFPQPMYESLVELSAEYIVPGADEIPQDRVCVLETNSAAVEAYLVGLSHEMARLLQYEGYPTDRRGTYFRQFWDPRGRTPPPGEDERKDVDPIHAWDRDAGLGAHVPARRRRFAGEDPDAAAEPLVLVIRGELFERYPDTIVYAAKAREAGPNEPGVRVPDLPEPAADRSGTVKHPIFRGQLDSDVAFFGFNLSETAAFGSDTPSELGWFFVLEEEPGEPRFGLDVGDPADVGTLPPGVTRSIDPGPDARLGTPDDTTETAPLPTAATGEPIGWDALSWYHLVDPHSTEPTAALDAIDYVPVEASPQGRQRWRTGTDEPIWWAKNGAHMASITWQRPFRVAIHADDMLPGETE